FVDRSSVEVIGNNLESITDLILPDRNSLGLETYANGGNVTLTSLKVYPLDRVWTTDSPLSSTNLKDWTTVSGEWADT
ncbi:GH32 C-terminal domain-containing protein, partial [Shouchella clausii]|uniref:GH32 C-terminal domain-containing protein n=1 Tax=Shouchella clausii TaxID=79880 RepID=UPI0015958181